ncbi:MAG: DUF2330 domain-containing protein [Phycisphaerae bacterium]|nr:DUF2330 domain-containing protein [Phycisphaerae bacterium]
MTLKHFKILLIICLLWSCQDICSATMVCGGDGTAEITGQRAIVVHRDGVETLIIESVLEGDSGEYGLIIPVPAVPKKVEVGYGGLIETVSMAIQPKIIHSFSRDECLGIKLDSDFGEFVFYFQ